MFNSTLRWLYAHSLPRPARSTLRLHLELIREQRWPATMELPAGHRILVLAPHMDDEVFGCGGTLAKCVATGGEVTVAYMTDGSKGYQRPEPLPSAERLAEIERQLVETRKDEARRAGKRLGLGEPVFLDLPDRDVRITAETVARLVRVFQQVRPELICLPFLTDTHRDHWMTNCLFIEAARRARLHPTLPCWGYEVWTPLVPNRVVDITEVIDVKRDAMAEFASQLAEYDYARAMLGLNAYRALLAGRGHGFAECFYVADLALYEDLYRRVVVYPHGYESSTLATGAWAA